MTYVAIQFFPDLAFFLLIGMSEFNVDTVCFLKLKLVEEILECLVFSTHSPSVHLIDG